MGTEENNKNKTGTKIVIFLLSIATIGQFSAELIPAFAGISPKPTSMFGSMLWSALLFMAIWSLRGKGKIVGFIIGAVIGFIVSFSAGFVAGYKQAEVSAVEQAVIDSNKALPKMIDEDTRMDKASIDQKAKEYSLQFTFVNILASDIDISVLNDNFTQAIKPGTCDVPQFQLFFSEGYTMNYIYNDKNGKFITMYSVKPTDCVK